jgi:CheY-like chemotaxis protein
MNTTPLQVLIVEDAEEDALLVVHQLRNSGYNVTWKRVQTADTKCTALEDQS